MGERALETALFTLKTMANGGMHDQLLNHGTTTANVTAEWTDTGLDSNCEASVRDLWKMQDLGTMKGSVSAIVVSHGVAMYKITPTS